MFHQFCLMLLLAVASNGQQSYQPQVAPANSPPITNPSNPGGLYNGNQTPENNLVSTTRTPYNNQQTAPQNYLESGRGQDSVCRERFGFYPINGRCDAYIECRNFRQATLSCPDGMNFNPNTPWPVYPCGYPMDVPCRGRGSVQPAKPTAECPHQYGFFPRRDNSLSPRERCSKYLMCSEGRAVVMDCPFGLAFNPASQRCDWPEVIPSCKDVLGFKCPAPPLGDDGQPQDIIQNYQYSQGECYYFWSCEQGRARVLSCDYGLAFSARTGRCEREDQVQCNHLAQRSLHPGNTEPAHVQLP